MSNVTYLDAPPDERIVLDANPVDFEGVPAAKHIVWNGISGASSPAAEPPLAPNTNEHILFFGLKLALIAVMLATAGSIFYDIVMGAL